MKKSNRRRQIQEDEDEFIPTRNEVNEDLATDNSDSNNSDSDSGNASSDEEMFAPVPQAPPPKKKKSSGRSSMAAIRQAYEDATASSFASTLIDQAPIVPLQKKSGNRSVSAHTPSLSVSFGAASQEAKKGLRRFSFPVPSPLPSSSSAGSKKSKKRKLDTGTAQSATTETSSNIYKVAVLVFLPYGVQEFPSEDQFQLNHSTKFPDKITVEELADKGLALIDRDEGYTFSKSWSAGKVDRKLRELFPEVFTRIDQIARTTGAGVALGWLLCSQRLRQAAVLPTLLPNGQKLYDHRTNPRRKWNESMVVFTSRQPLFNNSIEKGKHRYISPSDDHSEEFSKSESGSDSDVDMPLPSQIIKELEAPRGPRKLQRTGNNIVSPSTPTPGPSCLGSRPIIDLTVSEEEPDFWTVAQPALPESRKRKREMLSGSDTEPDNSGEQEISQSLSSFHLSNDDFNVAPTYNPYGKAAALLDKI